MSAAVGERAGHRSGVRPAVEAPAGLPAAGRSRTLVEHEPPRALLRRLETSRPPETVAPLAAADVRPPDPMAFTYDGAVDRARGREGRTRRNRPAPARPPAAARRRLPPDEPRRPLHGRLRPASCRRSRRRSRSSRDAAAAIPPAPPEPTPPEPPPQARPARRSRLGAGARRRRRPDHSLRVPRAPLPRRLGAGAASVAEPGRGPRRRRHGASGPPSRPAPRGRSAALRHGDSRGALREARGSRPTRARRTARSPRPRPTRTAPAPCATRPRRFRPSARLAAPAPARAPLPEADARRPRTTFTR